MVLAAKTAQQHLTAVFFSSLALISAAFVIFTLMAFSAHAADDAADDAAKLGPDGFITDLSEKAIEALTTDDITSAERNKRFRDMLSNAFDIPRVSGFLLGPYRRKASDEDLSAFQAALEDNVVVTYAWRFSEYNGEKFTVGGVQDGRRGAKVVSSTLSQTDGGAPIAIDWVVTETPEGWRIFDIGIEGLSLLVTQRDEYVSVIRRNGGKISALIEALEKQTAALRKRADG